MSHIEPDDLATLALDGSQPSVAERVHLDECAACRTEYDALVRTVERARPGPAEALEPPPSRVWSAIHEELGLAQSLAADPLTPPARDPSTSHVPPAAREEAVLRPASARARRRWWPVALAAASVGVVAGIALGAGLAGLGSGETASPTVVASATLDAFPGWSTSGAALLEEDDDGVRSIVVDLDVDVPANELREVWLIRSDASGLVSLGLLDGTSGRFVVPAGIDLDEFTLVDVSAEPVDGDPAHSGDSIVRGELRAL
jgi:hypothetical protein